MKVGKPKASIKKLELKLRNLTLNFENLVLEQVSDVDMTIWIETEPEDRGTEFEPPDTGTFKIIKMWPEGKVVFSDDRTNIIVTVMKHGDLLQILPEDVLNNLDIICEQAIKSGDRFTTVDYKKAHRKHSAESWARSKGFDTLYQYKLSKKINQDMQQLELF